MTKEKLLYECTRVRKAIEIASTKNICRDVGVHHFPLGCCGIASLVLGMWLLRFAKDIEYVHGWRDNQSHAWLEYQGWIIDITADQFEKINEKVLITDNRTFYDCFEEEGRVFVSKMDVNQYERELFDFVRENIK